MKPFWIATFDQRPHIALIPDGRLAAFFTHTDEGSQEILVRYSDDDGQSWSASERLLPLPMDPGGWGGPMALVDRDGELHIFLLNDAHTGIVQTGEQRQKPLPMSERRLDIWHIESKDGIKGWRPPKRIWKGYTGALNSVIQLQSGRMILPFSRYANRAWGDHTGKFYDDYTYTGQYECVSIYSDDAGDTWQLSPSVLRVPTPNLFAYGADEPVILELKDGRVWMLMRTQLGRLYESFSEDGVIWSSPQPTHFISSDSPAGIVRLPDGRIVLMWNSCLRFPYALGGRHVLHAAISEDEGRSWRGIREVVRDPLRNEPVPQKGDFGTAYPFPALTRDGNVILTTGQGKGRIAVVRFDPDWLYETHQREEFSAGLDEWSIFGTKGVERIPHPQEKDSNVLWIRKIDRDWPAAAVWNFPIGVQGRLCIKMLVRTGFAGGHIGLTDHFSTPFDQEDAFYNLFHLPIAPEGELPNGKKLAVDRWHILKFDWNCEKRTCRVGMDDGQILVLPQSRESSGACYLRLRSTVEDTDKAGFFVDFVECDVVNQSAPAKNEQ